MSEPREPHLGPEADGYADWINSQGPLEPPLWIKREVIDDLVGWTELKALASALTLRLIAVCLEPSYSTPLGLILSNQMFFFIIPHLASLVGWEECCIRICTSWFGIQAVVVQIKIGSVYSILP